MSKPSESFGREYFEAKRTPQTPQRAAVQLTREEEAERERRLARLARLRLPEERTCPNCGCTQGHDEECTRR